MNNRNSKAIIVLLLIFAVIMFLVFFIERDRDKIKLPSVKFERENILLLSSKEKEDLKEDLINHLNNEYYYKCKKIVFYNNTYDKSSNKKYFYALVIGADKSLVEITNLGNSKFKFSYIGNEVTDDSKSKVTGVTYLQIVNPKKYEKKKKLNKELDDMEKGTPDGTEGVKVDPKDGVSE